MSLLKQAFSPMQFIKSLHPFKGTPLKVKEVPWRHTLRVESTSLLKPPYLLSGSCQKSILQTLFYQNLQLHKFLWKLGTILLVLRNLNIKILSLMCQFQVTQCMTLCSPPRTSIRDVEGLHAKCRSWWLHHKLKGSRSSYFSPWDFNLQKNYSQCWEINAFTG